MRLLIVEAQKELLKFLKIGLEAEYFVVDTAEDGEKGLFLANTNEYDLLILDSNLPKTNGLDICNRLRLKKKNTRILILSIEGDVSKKVAFLNTGADDYITTPFSFEEVVARIKAILRRPNIVCPEILRLSDLSIDIQKHQVKRGNIEIYLTRKEFMLLEYLMKNVDKVISRGSIVEHVWDIHADIFSNTIETHILSLRKKIDCNSSIKLIHTIFGRGYKMSVKK